MDGVSAVGFTGFTAGDYYIVVRHRNHLGIITAVKQTINGISGTPVPYSLSQASVWQKYSISILTPPNNNAAMRDTTSGNSVMWGGNVNSNTNVRYTGGANDVASLSAALGGIQSGVLSNVYNAADINMNGNVRYTGGSNDLVFISTVLSAVQAAVLSQHL